MEYLTYIETNLNKLGVQMHRQLSVAAFLALTGLEEGDEAYVEVDGTNGVIWHMRYDNGTSKWRFLGGAPLEATVLTTESSNSTSYGALSTAGPSVTLPFAGDYDVSVETRVDSNTGWMSYDIGVTGAVDADGTVALGKTHTFRTQKKAGLTAVALVAKYKKDSATAAVPFGNRRMAVTPVTK